MPRLSSMAAVLETRLRQGQAEAVVPIDLISCLISDELTRRQGSIAGAAAQASRLSRPPSHPG